MGASDAAEAKTQILYSHLPETDNVRWRRCAGSDAQLQHFELTQVPRF